MHWSRRSPRGSPELDMTPAAFRRLALRLPETEESAHMGHPDFRVRGKIFATLGYPGAGWAMVKLSAEEQAAFVAMQPHVFMPAKGAWGRAGSTLVVLRKATKGAVQAALAAAWESAAPRTSGGKRQRTQRRPVR
jgi:hypothetical protein